MYINNYFINPILPVYLTLIVLFLKKKLLNKHIFSFALSLSSVLGSTIHSPALPLDLDLPHPHRLHPPTTYKHYSITSYHLFFGLFLLFFPPIYIPFTNLIACLFPPENIPEPFKYIL